MKYAWWIRNYDTWIKEATGGPQYGTIYSDRFGASDASWRLKAVINVKSDGVWLWVFNSSKLNTKIQIYMSRDHSAYAKNALGEATNDFW